MITIKLKIHTGFADAYHYEEISVPEQEWDSKSQDEKADYIQDAKDGFVNNTIYCTAEIIEESGDSHFE